jgi:hypothetical protein
MTYLRGLTIPGYALGLALASGCSGNANFGRDGAAGASTSGAGGTAGSGGTSVTGGQGGATTGGTAGSGGTSVTGGQGGVTTGGTAGSGGATGGQSACSPTAPCATGLCVGASCGSGWTCVVDDRTCATNLADYCGCDGVTFQDSSTCPTRPYAYRGACGQGTNCDPRDVVCNTLPPTCGQLQVPRVVGDCYDGSCVPIDQCLCTVAEECPDRSQYTCFLSANHCTPYLV